MAWQSLSAWLAAMRPKTKESPQKDLRGQRAAAGGAAGQRVSASRGGSAGGGGRRRKPRRRWQAGTRAPEEIDGLHQQVARRRRPQHGGVVGRLQPDCDGGRTGRALWQRLRRQPRQDAVQDAGADLGAAAAAAHLGGGEEREALGAASRKDGRRRGAASAAHPARLHLLERKIGAVPARVQRGVGRGSG